MTIIELRSENVKKLSVVTVKPAPTGLVIVAGKNAAGKSATLDSIEMAFAGADAMPSKPVRRGQDKATIGIDLGELTIKRVITASGGGSLVVRNKDGVKQDSPQKLLEGIYKAITFDPLSFARQDSKERGKTLRELLGLDFTALDAEREKLYADRTDVNRQAKSKEALVKQGKRYDNTPEEEEAPTAILEEQKKAIEQNESNRALRLREQSLKQDALRITNEINTLEGQIIDTDNEIARLTARKKGYSDAIAEKQNNVDSLVDEAAKVHKLVASLVDISMNDFIERLRDLGAINQKVRANKQFDVVAKEFKALTKRSEGLTAQIEEIDRKKRDALAAAKFPVPGLGLNDANEVIFDGIPFDQASTAQQLKISVAMGLAMNPKLRVMLIRQGNDLDADNLKLLADTATEAGAQIWIERVSTEGDVAVIIEDGHVKDPDSPPVSPPPPELKQERDDPPQLPL